MATFFLLIIYLAFISLGLPDSLLGAAWPVMQADFGAPIESAGWLFMIIAGGTIVSSLASGSVIKRLGTGKVTFISCIMTAGALLGFSSAPSLIWLFVFAVPLGLGAGSVDAGLNNYVATHYKAHHMSWLHCFWGVGATLGPIIMSQYIAYENGWKSGYFTVFVIQFGLVVLLFFTLPLWKRSAENSHGNLNKEQENTIALPVEPNEKSKPLKIKGVKLALFSFFFYCGVESTMGLWGSTFLVKVKDLPATEAAQWVSMYYAGITIGRLITGFITFKVSNRILIRMGQIIALVGAILLLLPLPTLCSLLGFIMIGLGCAPIYPCMLHETPARFGKAHSQTIMGYQMAVAYTGSTILPPLLGWLAAHTTMGVLPFFVVCYIVAMLVGSEKINRRGEKTWQA
ncbi:MAG: MFS transporter [Gorillibacterium sp.]|nr:MFS transporter [Gorillibacterium sp.]